MRIFAVPGMIALASLAACTPPPPASDAPAAASAGPDVLADSLEPFVRGLVDDGVTPAIAVAVVRRAAPAFVRGFGVRAVRTREPVLPGTGFYTASSTKSFTGTLAALLHQRGVIDLDAPLGRYLPELRMNPP